jgi:hypothetical protein
MANDVSMRSSNNTVTEYDPYEEFANDQSQRPFAGDLLIFSKHGNWECGQDRTDVEEGTRMVAHMPSIKRGWVKWRDNTPVATIMGLVAEGFRPPPREELGDLDENEWEEMPDGKPRDPWQLTNHVLLCDLEGQLFTFITSSKGGMSAVGELAKKYAQRRRMKPDEIPVIELGSRSYDHKVYGQTYAPVLHIAGWTKIPETFNDLSDALEDGSDETLELEGLSGNGDIVEDETVDETIDPETGEVIEDEPGEGENGDESVPEDEQDEEDEEEQEDKKPAPPRREAPQPPRRAAAMPQRSAPVKPAQRAAPTKPVPSRAPVKPAAKTGAKPTGKPMSGKPMSGKPAAKPAGKSAQAARAAASKTGAKKRSIRL